MGSDFRWVNPAWWRDWLFWLGVAAGLLSQIWRATRGGGPWWWYLAGGLTAFLIVVVVGGSARTVVRGYRETD